jgi:hypothetical protein
MPSTSMLVMTFRPIKVFSGALFSSKFSRSSILGILQMEGRFGKAATYL